MQDVPYRAGQIMSASTSTTSIDDGIIEPDDEGRGETVDVNTSTTQLNPHVISVDCDACLDDFEEDEYSCQLPLQYRQDSTQYMLDYDGNNSKDTFRKTCEQRRHADNILKEIVELQDTLKETMCLTYGNDETSLRSISDESSCQVQNTEPFVTSMIQAKDKLSLIRPTNAAQLAVMQMLLSSIHLVLKASSLKDTWREECTLEKSDDIMPDDEGEEEILDNLRDMIRPSILLANKISSVITDGDRMKIADVTQIMIDKRCDIDNKDAMLPRQITLTLNQMINGDAKITTEFSSTIINSEAQPSAIEIKEATDIVPENHNKIDNEPKNLHNENYDEIDKEARHLGAVKAVAEVISVNKDEEPPPMEPIKAIEPIKPVEPVKPEPIELKKPVRISCDKKIVDKIDKKLEAKKRKRWLKKKRKLGKVVKADKEELKKIQDNGRFFTSVMPWKEIRETKKAISEPCCRPYVLCQPAAIPCPGIRRTCWDDGIEVLWPPKITIRSTQCHNHCMRSKYEPVSLCANKMWNVSFSYVQPLLQNCYGTKNANSYSPVGSNAFYRGCHYRDTYYCVHLSSIGIHNGQAGCCHRVNSCPMWNDGCCGKSRSYYWTNGNLYFTHPWSWWHFPQYNCS